MALIHKRLSHSPSYDSTDMDDTPLPIREVIKRKAPQQTRSESSVGSSTNSDNDTIATREGSWNVSLNEREEPSLPTWSGNPQAPNDLAQSSIMSTARRRNYVGKVLFLGFVLVGIMAMVSSRLTVEKATNRLTHLEGSSQSIQERIRSTRENIVSLRRRMSSIDGMIHDQRQGAAHASSTETDQIHSKVVHLQERLKGLAKLSESLKDKVRKMSRDHLISTYGTGTNRVEVKLVFPDGKVGPDTFIIELASADTMPHSVDTFLRMVTAGLLDGCSFILNAMHVVKAAPLPYNGSSAAEKAKSFTSHGLESVAFREYNKTYTHEQFTVGFAADGSPSFYVNTEDNTEIHIGDPCFGRIVEGFDAIKRLESSPTRNGIWFEKRIGIKHARLL